MSGRRIIAFTGLAGSGKSTAAAYLEERGFTRTRFAGPLKAMLISLYRNVGVETNDIYRRIEGDLKEKPDPILQGKTPRQALQWLGTEWGRDLIGPGFWTGLWLSQLTQDGQYVVEDCRFPNEAEVVKMAGGTIVKIACPWAGSVTGAGHSSEAHEIVPHFVIENSVQGNFENLYRRIDAVLGW